MLHAAMIEHGGSRSQPINDYIGYHGDGKPPEK